MGLVIAAMPTGKLLASTLDVPALADPTDGATVYSPFPFSWNAVTGASTYQLLVDNNADFSSPVLNKLVAATSYNASLPFNVSYSWKVRAISPTGVKSDWSETRSVNIVPPPTPDTPTLSSPADAGTALAYVTLTWNPAVAAAKYKIVIDDNPDFLTPVFGKTVATTSIRATRLKTGMTYYWHVQGINSVGIASDWSDVWTVTVVPPDPPILLDPANGSTAGSLRPTFTWQPSNAIARLYQIQVSMYPDFSVLKINRRVASISPSYTWVRDFLPGTTYYWRVRVLSLAKVWSDWSTVNSVMTPLPGNLVDMPPAESGYITSPEELEFLGSQAQLGTEPYATLVNDFLSDLEAPSTWQFGAAGGAYEIVNDNCISPASPQGDQFISQQGGAQAVYKKMIGYYLTHDVAYAQVARNKIIELTKTSNFGGDLYLGTNPCILKLAFSIPLWIQSATLLEGTPVWSAVDRATFQNWLATEVYHKVAWASRVRRNNWGSAGSLAASMIGDYLSGQPVTLIEYQPEYRELTPSQAYQEHNAMQLQRMNTVWKGDSKCAMWGIRPYGGMPDELRRGTTGCDGQWLTSKDDAYVYQITEIDHLVFHAEYLVRRGDASLFNNKKSDGSGSLLKAILFVIDNPVKPAMSYDWEAYKAGILNVAYAYYHDERLRQAVPTNSVQRGGMISFGQLTYPIQP